MKTLTARATRTMKASLVAICVAFMARALTGCLDFAIPDEHFLCRNQQECGEGFACLRGPGCYCVCKELGSEAEPNCSDPACDNVTVQE